MASHHGWTQADGMATTRTGDCISSVARPSLRLLNARNVVIWLGFAVAAESLPGTKWSFTMDEAAQARMPTTHPRIRLSSIVGSLLTSCDAPKVVILSDFDAAAEWLH